MMCTPIFLQKLMPSNLKEKLNVDDFLDWMNKMEMVFECHGPPEEKKVKLVAIKLRRNTTFWWENLKKLRERAGISKIITWDKMMKSSNISPYPLITSKRSTTNFTI